jgi:hypothetical protein
MRVSPGFLLLDSTCPDFDADVQQATRARVSRLGKLKKEKATLISERGLY